MCLVGCSALQESSTLVTSQASSVTVTVHLRLNDVSSMNYKIIYVLLSAYYLQLSNDIDYYRLLEAVIAYNRLLIQLNQQRLLLIVTVLRWNVALSYVRHSVI
jgi:hypothetical protein